MNLPLGAWIAGALLLLGGPAQPQRGALAPEPLGSPDPSALHFDPRDLGADLAGVPTAGAPHFTFVRAFNEGDSVLIGVDTRRWPGLAGRRLDVYVTAHRSLRQWLANPELVDVRGRRQTITPVPRSLRDNLFQVDAGTLSGTTGTLEVGVGYDVVLDFNRNGLLDAPDLIDGYGDEAGFYVMPDLTLPGPYATREVLHSGGNLKRQDIYFPSNVSSLEELPLVIVSHGNGHNYRWYDHIGEFLASWGYVVVSHENNTGPGIQAASTTTLSNTEHFLSNLDVIAGGVLDGHVDSNRMVWIGHSRGGEGIVRAYQRLLNGTNLAQSYDASDIKLLSSIAPTNFLPTQSNPRQAPFHVWTGGADADVNGCASCQICQTFQLHDRAKGWRMSTSLHGVGHADFHDGGGGSVASGPCRVGRNRTHKVMLGYLLPLLEHVVDGNVPCKDYLWRQYESLRPLGVPEFSCIVVDLMYRENPIYPRLVLDDFQSEPATSISSSGGAVVGTVDDLFESNYHDSNRSFTSFAGSRMNGMTMAGSTGDSRGVVFEWDGTADRYLMFEMPREAGDLRGYSHLSFRAAQSTRHPLTRAELGDLTFEVQLIDTRGHRSTISIGAYGGGIEEPYQRTGCGQGTGWANEFETIRIPLQDFVSSAPVDLRSVAAVAFLFGPAHGSPLGRIGLDEIEFTAEAMSR